MAGLNPADIMNLLKCKNPQAAVMQLAQNNSNPLVQNLVQMAQQGNTQGIQQFAENFFKQRGTDLNTQLNNFMGSISQIR